MNSFALVHCTLPLLAAALAAQTPVSTAVWHLPFHTGNDGAAWAAGPDYKVAVDDGMTFYPLVPATEDAHQPLRWRTRSIRLGAVDLLPPAGIAGAPARARTAGFRVEIDHGAALEIYDARREGVEQQFVVRQPAAGSSGDLVVVGDVSGPLHSDPCPDAHQALTFRDAAGRGRVTYGAATAIDAAGRRLAMATAFADGQIRLSVPAAWLATAAWPVSIDPLLTRQTLSGSPTGPAERPQVVRSRAQNRLFVAESRRSAGFDWDLVVRAYADDWTPLGNVFSDVSLTSMRRSSLAYAMGPDKVVLAIGCEAALLHWVRIYVHPAGSLVANAGASLDVPRPADTHDSAPSIGGSANQLCYVAFRRDQTVLPVNSPQSRVLGVRVDAQTSTLAAPQDLHSLAGNDYDAEHPAVSDYSETGGWLVVWQEYDYDVAGDDWDIVGERIDAGGAPAGGRELGQRTHTWYHKLTPHVAGSGSRFAVTWVLRDNDGSKTTAQEGFGVYVQRLTWSSLGTPEAHPVHQVEAIAQPDVLLASGTRRMSFDHLTDSLWAVTWDRLDLGELRIARLGYDGRIAESAVLALPPGAGGYHSPSLAFDDEALAFPVVFASAGVGLGDPIYGTRFVHGAAAAIPVGASCAGSMAAFNSSAHLPFAGSELFGIRLTGGRALASTVLAAGLAPAVLPLPMGGPGCLLLLDPTRPLVVAAAVVSDAAGEVQVPLPIPSGARGDNLWQFVQLDGDRLWSSNALFTRIR